MLRVFNPSFCFIASRFSSAHFKPTKMLKLQLELVGAISLSRPRPRASIPIARFSVHNQSIFIRGNFRPTSSSVDASACSCDAQRVKLQSKASALLELHLQKNVHGWIVDVARDSDPRWDAGPTDRSSLLTCQHLRRPRVQWRSTTKKLPKTLAMLTVHLWCLKMVWRRNKTKYVS